MVVYIDVVFLINFIFNFLILYIVHKISKNNNTSMKRLIISSLTISFLYCFIIIFLQFSITRSILVSFFIIFVGIKIAFIKPNKIEFTKLILLSYLVTFSLGGTIFGLYYLVSADNIFLPNVSTVSIKLMIISSFIFYIIIKIFVRVTTQNELKRQHFVKLKINLDEFSVELNCLVDTGNSLKDPTTSTPAIICEFDSIKNLLPPTFRLAVYEKKFDFEDVDYEFIKRIKMIPFKSIGNDNGMLVGFKPDYIEVFDDDNVVKIENVVICIYDNKFGSSTYQGLLNPVLLTKIT